MILVLGKGGVGRSTVALALARSAAAEGRRTALVEVHGSRTLAGWLAAPDGPQRAHAVAPSLDLWSLSASGCLGEFGMDRFGAEWLTRVVFGGPVMRALLDAIPGMDDLLHLGRINRFLEDSADPYELVVIDAPATGHGLAFYRTAGAMAAMAGRGPIHLESQRIADRLADPARTALVVVSLAEELPVRETAELVETLGREERTVQLVVANRLVVDPVGPLSWDAIDDALREADLADLAESAARLRARLATQAGALAALRAAVKDAPLVGLEQDDHPSGPGLAARLGAALEGT